MLNTGKCRWYDRRHGFVIAQHEFDNGELFKAKTFYDTGKLYQELEFDFDRFRSVIEYRGNLFRLKSFHVNGSLRQDCVPRLVTKNWKKRSRFGNTTNQSEKTITMNCKWFHETGHLESDCEYEFRQTDMQSAIRHYVWPMRELSLVDGPYHASDYVNPFRICKRYYPNGGIEIECSECTNKMGRDQACHEELKCRRLYENGSLAGENCTWGYGCEKEYTRNGRLMH